jgi:hypothetical protein
VGRLPVNFLKMLPFFCICMVIGAFLLSLWLIKSRQNIIASGRKIAALEKLLAFRSTANGDLNAEIAKLSSSQSLRGLLNLHEFVLAGSGNTVKIGRLERNFYATSRTKIGKFAAGIPSNRRSKARGVAE